jgi:serine/threonine protein phosphatase PrpC
MASIVSSLESYHDTVEPIVVDRRIFEATTSIGLRPTQEDRFVLIPRFFREDAAFCGVFDGTVGDDASDFIGKNVVSFLCRTEEFANPTTGVFSTEPTGGASTDIVAEKIRSALRQTFINSDQALIEMCTEKKLHYASSTGVSAFLWRNLLTIAHVGDSKACIARLIGDEIQPEWLTVDHKPNMPHELKRIEQNGGSLAWLHGNKPYIRCES